MMINIHGQNSDKSKSLEEELFKYPQENNSDEEDNN